LAAKSLSRSLKAHSYTTAAAFRRGLEDRLAAIARDEHSDLQRIRRQVAFDRLLARLFVMSEPPWILKGAYCLELKLHAARTTKDIDLGLASPPRISAAAKRLSDTLLDILQTAAERDLGDFFVYRVGEPSMDLNAAPLGGSRYPVDSLLDGRSFAKFHLDIGIGDAQNGPTEVVVPRDWLGFAAIPAPSFQSISREDHFAQKLHAYTLPRGEQRNTRVKDLIDLVLLIDSDSLNLERVRDALVGTFERRGTHSLPASLEPPPEFWRPVFQRLAEQCGISPNIDSQFQRVQQFFDTHLRE
jgi:hypothetical protein